MHLTHSSTERSALHGLIDLGAKIAANPGDETLRYEYRRQHQLLREHSRAGALIYRATHMPAPRHIAIDAKGLAAFLLSHQSEPTEAAS